MSAAAGSVLPDQKNLRPRQGSLCAAAGSVLPDRKNLAPAAGKLVCSGRNVVVEQKILNSRDPEAPVQEMWSRNCIFGKMWTQLSTRIYSFLHVIAANIRKYPGLILLQDREVVTNP